MRKVRVELGPNSYDINIGAGLNEDIVDFCSNAGFSRQCLIVADENTGELYGDELMASLVTAGLDADIITIPAGEASKSLMMAEDIYTKCIELGMDRKSAIFALGGGVVGDLAGFVAATYMRGINFVQCPTSLLAAVDASVGGKVAVNHYMGKNLIGAFYQPKAVFIDTNWLSSLPQREICTGLSEIVKYGIIYDAEFFEFLENNIEDELEFFLPTFERMIIRSCEIKAAVVAKDEKELGLRAILNFGHTMGHAIEKNTQYERYNHGEAVAIGMVCAARISLALNMIDSELLDRVIRLLSSLKLPVKAEGCDVDTLYEAIFHDKKTVNGNVKWILMDKGLGMVKAVRDVPEDVVRTAMQECLA